MITVDNYEVETCGSRDTVTEDLKGQRCKEQY